MRPVYSVESMLERVVSAWHSDVHGDRFPWRQCADGYCRESRRALDAKSATRQPRLDTRWPAGGTVWPR